MTDEKGTALVPVPEIIDTSQQPKAKPEPKTGLKDYLRIFTFSSRSDVVLNLVAALAAIASGSTLALVNVVFGGFVTVVQDFTQGGDVEHFRHEVNRYALYFVYLGIARFVLVYTYTVCTTIAGARIARSIRYAFLKSTLSQDVAFFDEGGHGSVSSQIVTNGNLIQSGLGEKLGLTVQATSAFISAFVVAFATNAKLTGITICIVPTMVIVVAIAAGIDAGYETKQLEIWARAGSFAEDVLSSVRTVHAFWARPRLVAKHDKYLQEARAVGQKKSPVYVVLFSTEFFLIYAGFALCFWEGLRMYNSGEISTPGTIVTVLFSAVVAATSLTQIAPMITTFVSATSAAAALFRSIDRKSAIDPFDTSGETIDEFDGNVKLRNINFTYPARPDTQVLHDFTLDAPSGKTTALVGASGSGKSTIVALLERWYNPDSGSITLDETPIDKLNLKWLRTNIRLVQQEPVLFMGTVFENVKYGLVGTSLEHSPERDQRKLVEDACRIANAHEFVSDLPEGYDTQCGERAGLLSGGQKQRIAIARSIISNPKVLLLDEATSALDPPSERAVQKALDQAAVGRTTIVIAHKLATIKKADNIVVMSKGRIIEQGTHQALITADGAYSRLVKIQDLGQAADKLSQEVEEEDNASSSESIALRKSSTRFGPEEVNRMLHNNDRDDYDLHKQINMLRIIWIFVVEQKHLILSYIIVSLACLIGGATYPGQALLFSKLLGVFQLQEPQRTERGNFFALMFFVIALGNLVAYGLMGWYMNLVVQEMILKYRSQLFDAMLKQDMQFFDRPENTSGAMTSRLSANPQSIMELMGFNLAIILVCIINLVASVILAMIFSWRLGVVVIFAGLPPLVASGWIRIQLDMKIQNANSKRYTASASLAGEGVAAIRTVISLTLEPTILRRFAERLEGVIHATIWQTLHIMVWFSLTQTIEFFYLALGFWYGCLLLSQNKITMEAFYITFVGTFFSGQAASQFFSYSTSITKAKGGANYIFWLRALPPRIGETNQNQNVGPNENVSIAPSLNNLRFSYPLRPEAQVLRGVSLSVQPGQFVALVGASGCGKSTLVAMLERFYDPVTGRINIQEGVDITSLNPKLYRDLIGLVQQEPTLYQETIRENVALGARSGNNETSDDQVIDALKQANAWEFVSSLPQGLDTLCGSRGLQLSGGQRQRIAIARALVRDPKIILLDEATSALDTESEKIVQAALSEAAKKGKRVTVAVAHRLSTIKDADVICVFLGGKIVEVGTHAQLLNRGELYAKMCAAQSLDQEAGP